MRRMPHLSALAAALSMVAIAIGPLPASAASVGFGTHYAVEITNEAYGDGYVRYKINSVFPNNLEVAAIGNGFAPTYMLAGVRSGWIQSDYTRYTGPNGGSITVKIWGTFQRELVGGISVGSLGGFRSTIKVALRDLSTGTDAKTWTLENEEVLCVGASLGMVSLGDCNGPESRTFGSPFTKTGSGAGIVSNHNYAIRVYAGSIVQFAGTAFGAQTITTTRGLSGSLTW